MLRTEHVRVKAVEENGEKYVAVLLAKDKSGARWSGSIMDAQEARTAGLLIQSFAEMLLAPEPYTVSIDSFELTAIEQ